jgi:hypothetical protein
MQSRHDGDIPTEQENGAYDSDGNAPESALSSSPGRFRSSTFLVQDLVTDDGLALSGFQLRAARSNWVRPSRDRLHDRHSRLRTICAITALFLIFPRAVLSSLLNSVVLHARMGN